MKLGGIFFGLLLSLSSVAQDQILWLEWDEAMEVSKDDTKKYIIDLYTKWCGWCKKMDKTTFQDPYIVNYINENFIAIKFDAEDKRDFEYQGEVFDYTRGGRRGYHTLAAKMTNGQLRYPTVIFLDEKSNVLQAIPGFLDKEVMEMILAFFANDHHKTTPWDIFERRYTRPTSGDSHFTIQKN
jgi:thioredoxin-related protein